MQNAHPDFVKPCVQRFRQGAWQDIEETLAQEIAVQVSYAGGSKKLWAWPHDLESLAAGHVLLDCLPRENVQEATAGLCHATVSPVGVSQSAQTCKGIGEETGEGQGPHFAVSFSAAPESAPAAPVLAGLPDRISAQALLEQMAAFIKAPGLWDSTGCFHRAALLDVHSQRLVRVAEDIGRHNCVDRLAGYAALHSPAALHPSRFVLLISSRITASLYHKARRAGFCCMVSRSAITSGSYRAALADGTSLLGFCRPEDARLTVFADKEGRIY